MEHFIYKNSTNIKFVISTHSNMSRNLKIPIKGTNTFLSKLPFLKNHCLIVTSFYLEGKCFTLSTNTLGD